MLCLVAEKMVADTKVNLEILSPTFWVFFFSNYFKSCKLRQLLTSDLKILIIFFLFIFVGFIGNRAEGIGWRACSMFNDFCAFSFGSAYVRACEVFFFSWTSCVLVLSALKDFKCWNGDSWGSFRILGLRFWT